MKTIIIDNFLPYPHVVREWALQQKYYTCKETVTNTGTPSVWPGVRTNVIVDLDQDYADNVLSQVHNISTTFFGVSRSCGVRSCFQVTTADDGDSWVHKDDIGVVAGLLFLTPNPPPDSGTIIYTPPPHKEHDIIGNSFNRLILYDANSYHKSNKYFGSNLRDGRLTQLFFLSMD